MDTNLKNQYDVVEYILAKLDFKTKEEVVEYAETMLEVANLNASYTQDIKDNFAGALDALKGLSLQEMKNIKKFLI